MDSDRKIILVTSPLFWSAKNGKDALQNRFDVIFSEKLNLGDTNVCSSVVAIVLGDQYCGPKEMDLFPELKTIARSGTGYDNLDLDAAKKRGLVVTRVTEVSAKSVSEYALGCIFALCRNIVRSDHILMNGKWERNPGTMLSELNVGIVGLGAIGRALAYKLKALGVKKLLSWNRTTRPIVLDTVAECNMDLVDFDDVLRNSDVLVLCLALNAETRHIIDAKKISILKPTTMLVNIARGALINELALAKAVREKKIAGVALDAYSQEPPFAEDFFKKLQVEKSLNANIIMTPHMAIMTKGAAEEAAMLVVRNVLSVLDNKSLDGIEVL